MLRPRVATRSPCLRHIVALLFALPGCAAGPDPEFRLEMSQLPYPEEATYGDDLDLVITRHAWLIDLTNRTPRSYEDVQLWLNRQFVRRILRIDIGTGHRYALKEFINRYEESFPPGGFLRPEKGMPVVLAELYDPRTELKHRLLVQP